MMLLFLQFSWIGNWENSDMGKNSVGEWKGLIIANSAHALLSPLSTGGSARTVQGRTWLLICALHHKQEREKDQQREAYTVVPALISDLFSTSWHPQASYIV